MMKWILGGEDDEEEDEEEDFDSSDDESPEIETTPKLKIKSWINSH